LNRSPEAVANLQRSIEIARSNGQKAEASELEEWLKHYQIELQRESAPYSPSPGKGPK
jgi:hypothetical protein